MSDASLELYRQSVRAFATVNPMVTAMLPVVDHRAPICDGLCRCRDCKPPFAAQTFDRASRITGLVALAAAVWSGIVVAVRCML